MNLSRDVETERVLRQSKAIRDELAAAVEKLLGLVLQLDSYVEGLGQGSTTTTTTTTTVTTKGDGGRGPGQDPGGAGPHGFGSGGEGAR